MELNDNQQEQLCASMAAAEHNGARGATFKVGLSTSDWAWLIEQMTIELAKHGVTVTDGGDGSLRGSGGRIFGLIGPAQRLRDEPRANWAAFIADYCATMASIRPELPSDPEEFLRRLHPRIVAEGFYPGAMPAYAKNLGAGLFQIAALQNDNWVALLLGDNDLDLVGGWRGAEEVAFANLRRCLLRHEVWEHNHEPDAAIHTFTGEHKFVASSALILDELMARIGADTHGKPLLVGLPTRETLLVHIPVGPSAWKMIDRFAEQCLSEFRTQPGALSPDVYWRAADGGWLVIKVNPVGGRVVQVDVSKPVAAHLDHLARRQLPWYGAA